MTAIAPIPFTVTAYDRGANGVPSRTNPTPIIGITSYEDAISNQFGFESMRISFESSADDALEWLRGGLLRPIESVKPNGTTRWDGLIHEITVTLGKVTIVLSLEDMANRLRVKYATDSGSQTKTSTYSNAGSIAVYGTKDQVLNLSTVTATAAANRAQTALASLAWPTSKRATQTGSSGTGGRITVEIKAVGWYEALDWVLTSSTSTTVTATNTQVTNLLSSYNAVNNFFSTSATAIVATGISDTEYIDPETSFREKIETLLAQGNSAQQRLAWGLFDNTRAMTVRVWAGATPSVISYYESARDGSVRDPYGNIVAPWDLAPDVMCETIDLFDAPPASDQVASVTRKYVGRVTLRIDNGGVQASLEPDDVTSVEAALAGPVGAGPAGQSARQTKIERKIKKQISSTVPTSDSPSYTTGGVLKPSKGGTGINNSDTNTLTLSSAGTLDLNGNTLTIAASGTAALGTGTSGRVAEWSGTNTVQASTLIKSGAGVLTLSAASSLTLTLSGGSATLDFSTPTTGDALMYDGTKFTPTAAPSGNGTTGRVAKWTSATAIGADTLAKTGTGVLTLTSGTTTMTLTLSGGSTTLDFTTPTTGDVLQYDGTKFTPTAPTVYAPTNATYIVQTANGTLTNEQVLGSLASGYLKVTTTTGVLSSQAIPIPIADGGTGQTSAANALSALGGIGGSGLTPSGGFNRLASFSATSTLTSSADLGWDDTNHELLIAGASSPHLRIRTASAGNRRAAIYFDNNPTLMWEMGVDILGGGTKDFFIYDHTAAATRMVIKTTGYAQFFTGAQFGGLISGTPSHTVHVFDDDAAKTTTTTWTVTSDARTKEILCDYGRGLDFLRSLPNPRVFRRNGRFGTVAGEIGVGYIAQELETVAPEWVMRRPYEEDGKTVEVLKVNQHELSYVLVNAVLELARRLEDYERGSATAPARAT